MALRVVRASLVGAVLLLSLQSAKAEETTNSLALGDQVEALISGRGDLLDLKLAADKLVDPTLDVASGRKSFEQLAASLKAMAAEARADQDKLKVLRQFLYQPGPWNGSRPFSYNMDDPRGSSFGSKLLMRYMETRKGNCVTMPILAMLLGREIGLTMTMAQAPLHTFVKFTDGMSREWNLEATSGLGFTRDVWYRQELPMTDKAVASGVYMRALSEEETASLLAMVVLEHAVAQKRPEDMISLATVILKHYPSDAPAMVWRGSAYSLLIDRYILQVYPDPEHLPPEALALAQGLSVNNQSDFAAAEALGWTEQDGIKP